MDDRVVIARVGTAPVVLDKAVVAFRLTAPEDRATAERLGAIARSERESVLLELACVQADRPPGAVWEVYVGLPVGAAANAESPHFVGNVALFGDGIKSEAKQKPFATLVFPLDRAIAAAADPADLIVTFVPSSGVVDDGRPRPPEIKAAVRIGEVNLLLDRARQ